jgi:hypothetical protein
VESTKLTASSTNIRRGPKAEIVRIVHFGIGDTKKDNAQKQNCPCELNKRIATSVLLSHSSQTHKMAAVNIGHNGTYPETGQTLKMFVQHCNIDIMLFER